MFSQEIWDSILVYLSPKDIVPWVNDGHHHLLRLVTKAKRKIVLEKCAYDDTLKNFPTEYFKGIDMNTCIHISILQNYVDQFKLIWTHRDGVHILNCQNKPDVLGYALCLDRREIVQHILGHTEPKHQYTNLVCQLIGYKPNINFFRDSIIHLPKIAQRLGEIGSVDTFRHFVPLLADEYVGYYSMSLQYADLFQNSDLVQYINDTFDVHLNYEYEENLRLALVDFSFGEVPTHVLNQFLHKHNPSENILDVFLNRVFLQTNFVKSVIQYAYDTNKCSRFFKSRFTYHITNGRCNGSSFVPWLFSLFTDSINFTDILLALGCGNIDIVRHIYNQNRICGTETELNFVHQLVNDDPNVFFRVPELACNINLYRIACICNLINILNTFSTFQFTNVIQLPNVTPETIELLVRKRGVDQVMTPQFFGQILSPDTPGEPFIQCLKTADKTLSTFLYVHFPKFRCCISKINVDDIWTWYHPDTSDRFIRMGVNTLFLNTDRSGFKQLADWGFDFYSIPKAIVPQDNTDEFKNIIDIVMRHDGKNNNENLNILDLCFSSFDFARESDRDESSEITKMHRELITHLYA